MYPSFLFRNVLAGLLLAVFIGLGAIWLCRKIGLMDIPGTLPHKQHASPTPIAGGLTFVLTLLIVCLLFNWEVVRQLWDVLLPTLIVFAVSLWDDFKQLRARYKLAGQLLASLLLIVLGNYVRILKPGFLGLGEQVTLLLNWAVTLFWMVGVTNAMNFVDSMDGLVVGLGGIAVAFLVLATLGSTQMVLLQLLTIMIGCFIGLFLFNAPPAKLFLGDSGAQTIGFLLAAVGILYTPNNLPQSVSWFLPILILGVPIFDTSLVVISRLRRHKLAYQAGLDHTYHRLVALGLDSSHAVALTHTVAIILGCAGFIALNLSPLAANLIFGIVCLTGIAALIFLDSKAYP